MKTTVRVAITGCRRRDLLRGLLPRIASGEMFGKDVPVVLQLLEVPVDKVQAALKGVAMELDDCAFPLLQDIILSDKPEVAFKDANWCLLVGSKPRGPGQERADLLKDNGRIFIGQGKAIDAVAAADCRVAVVGNPCNTNCMIAAAQAKRLGPDRFTAMVRLDQNRAQTQLARRTRVAVSEVKDIIVYGNHSPTMFPDVANATITGRPAAQVVNDPAWLAGDFLATVGSAARPSSRRVAHRARSPPPMRSSTTCARWPLPVRPCIRSRCSRRASMASRRACGPACRSAPSRPAATK